MNWGFFIYFSLNIVVSYSKNVLSTSVSWRSSIQSSTLIRSRIFFWISGSVIHAILVLNASRNSISGLYFSEKRFQFGSERRMDGVCDIVIIIWRQVGLGVFLEQFAFLVLFSWFLQFFAFDHILLQQSDSHLVLIFLELLVLFFLFSEIGFIDHLIDLCECLLDLLIAFFSSFSMNL